MTDERPKDHHGFPCPDRLWPLDPAPWNLSSEEAAERRRARGDYVSQNPRANWVLEAMRGAQYRPKEEQERLAALVRARDPLAEAQEEIKRLKAEITGLKAARTWRTTPPPLSFGADDPHQVGPVVSGWMLVKTAHGRQYTAEMHDWRIDPDDEPNPKWVMAGRDGYTIDDVTGWMPLPEAGE